jgi:hypothetical protein
MTGTGGLLVSPAVLAEELASEPAPVLLDVRWLRGGCLLRLRRHRGP